MRRCISIKTPTTTVRFSTRTATFRRIKTTSLASLVTTTRAHRSIYCCGRKIGRRSPRPPTTGLSISSPARGKGQTRNIDSCWLLYYPDTRRIGQMAKKRVRPETLPLETLPLRNTARRNRKERLMASDRLFAEKKDLVGNFALDRDTVLVFDDMLNCS